MSLCRDGIILSHFVVMSLCRDVVIFRQAPDFVMSLRCDAVATVLLCRGVVIS